MEDNKKEARSEIIIYQTEDGSTKIDVKFQDETVWLTQAQLCELYQTSKSNISEHIKHIFEEGELEEDSVVRKFRTTGADGKNYNITHYNLDMIISLGYRVKSLIATQFRRWATERLKEYMIKGFTMDDERLKNLGGGNYWKELLDRIRDIRSSEKVMYRQVLDLYATSVDYNPKSSESIAFFKMVQNKLHYAAHGHTAAEVIYERANAEQPFMGLKNFSGDFPTLKDIGIAKNYLNEEELKILNNIVSGYFDFAEIQAMRHNPMYMSDYVEHLDNVLKTTGEKLLQGAGTISHAQAIEKATVEYRKYQVQNLSPVEEKYLENINKSIQGSGVYTGAKVSTNDNPQLAKEIKHAIIQSYLKYTNLTSSITRSMFDLTSQTDGDNVVVTSDVIKKIGYVGIEDKTSELEFSLDLAINDIKTKYSPYIISAVDVKNYDFSSPLLRDKITLFIHYFPILIFKNNSCLNKNL